MSSLREKRSRRSNRKKNSIKSNADLYDSIGVDPTLTIEDEKETPDLGLEIKVSETETFISSPTLEHYDYQEMAHTYTEVNVAQQLGNYRSAMDFLTHHLPNIEDKLTERLKKIIYDYPNVDMSEYLNKDNAKLYSWVIQNLFQAFGEKYLGTIYVLGGGMGLLPAMLLDTKLRFENIRSFDINGTAQFLSDELMANELLLDWRFKATTQDIFNIGYDENVFSTNLPDGSISSPFTEIPGTVINTNISYIEQYEAWWDMIPDMRRIVIVGETGDVPRPFSSSNAFNRKFTMSYETYTGVKQIGEKYFFMKIGYK
jgi:hypothetical protein